jgi:hypothetical protein
MTSPHYNNNKNYLWSKCSSIINRSNTIKATYDQKESKYLLLKFKGIQLKKMYSADNILYLNFPGLTENHTNSDQKLIPVSGEVTKLKLKRENTCLLRSATDTLVPTQQHQLQNNECV